MRVYVNARLLTDKGTEEIVSVSELRKGQKVLCEAGDVIPLDGEVIEGIASVDESAITGESAPVIRESGGDRSAVTGGTRVISDGIVIRITAEPGNTFLDRMIAMVEGASRQRTPNEIALGILLAALTIVFIAVVFSLPAMAGYIEDSRAGARLPCGWPYFPAGSGLPAGVPDSDDDRRPAERHRHQRH